MLLVSIVTVRYACCFRRVYRQKWSAVAAYVHDSVRRIIDRCPYVQVVAIRPYSVTIKQQVRIRIHTRKDRRIVKTVVFAPVDDLPRTSYFITEWKSSNKRI